MTTMTPWKLATIGASLIGVTALSTGATTAYFMRPATTPPAAAATSSLAAPAEAAEAPPATPAVRYVAAHPAPRPVAARPRVARAVAPVAADCQSTGDRVWRIAKPGAIGGLLGAAVGAAGGAVADGGKAAGKGALIGGIAGAVLGGGYGAYKTHNECGSVFGAQSGNPYLVSR